MTRTLITSALPYINGIKHLGNFAGSLLPADIHARFLRQCGEEVAFICATDEHGTPAELGAAAAGQDVRTYCDTQHEIQADIYRRLDLSFDHFGRTSSPTNHALTQRILLELDAANYIEEREIQQIWSPADQRFLPDRYVEGTCPHCGGGARGDQCDVCSTTLDPVELINPRSAISGADGLELRTTRHLFLRQSALVDELSDWLDTRRDWPPQVLGIARGWLAKGLEDRCITRDLEWGVPIPKDGFENKVAYVWFDAPIGYISATTEWAEANGHNVDDWWSADADVRHIQFLAKDNVPFHAISFPATLIGAGGYLHTADIIKGVNWLLYEGGKFSTSRKRGIFLNEALDLLPADPWRWWLASRCPETADVDFTFQAFAEGVNTDLADKFGNLVSRVLGFTASRYGEIPDVKPDPAPNATAELAEHLKAIEAHHRQCEIRKTADRVRSLWDLANAYVANAAPWTINKTDPEQAAAITRTALGFVRAAAVVAWPFIPASAEKVLSLLGEEKPPTWTTSPTEVLKVTPGTIITKPEPLFHKLDDTWVETQTLRFKGTVAD